MDRESIHLHIADLRSCHGELEGVEAKAAHRGIPVDLCKPYLTSPIGTLA